MAGLPDMDDVLVYPLFMSQVMVAAFVSVAVKLIVVDPQPVVGV